MAKIRLMYFSGRGRAEILRLILAAGKLDYDNVRFSIPEWPEYKKRKMQFQNIMQIFFSSYFSSVSPWGTFPLLEYDGWHLGGTLAIARFIAKKTGLAGDTDRQQAEADSMAEQCQEYCDSKKKFYGPS